MSTQIAAPVDKAEITTSKYSNTNVSEKPFKGLTLEKIKATKKQVSQERKSYQFCDLNSFCMKDKEFDALMSGKGKWLQTCAMFVHHVWDEYLSIPEEFKNYAKVYVLTFDAKEEGYISTSFYVFYEDQVFRAPTLEYIQTILNHLKNCWLSELRDYIESELDPE